MWSVGCLMSGYRITRLEKGAHFRKNIANAISDNLAGRNEELVAFVEMLSLIDGPYTIMLDAPWGEGKTFFIKSAQYVMNALAVSETGENDKWDERIRTVVEPPVGE